MKLWKRKISRDEAYQRGWMDGYQVGYKSGDMDRKAIERKQPPYYPSIRSPHVQMRGIE